MSTSTSTVPGTTGPCAVRRAPGPRAVRRASGRATVPAQRGRPVETRIRRPRPAPRGRVRLTRRGRVVVTLLLLVLVLATAVLVGGTSVATGDAGSDVPTRTVVVAEGDTLWQIAGDIAEPGDVREMVHRIEKLNSLPGPALEVGQELAVPVE